MQEAPDQTLDIQHDTDPAQDHGPARRIPHLGHALLFFTLAFFFLATYQSIALLLIHPHTAEAAAEHPGLLLTAQIFTYLTTLLVSFWLFPRLWQRSFLHGIQWNVLAAHRRWFWIVPTAIALSLAAQYADHFVAAPEKNPFEILFKSAGTAWLTTAFGVLLVPVVEEIAFRGFLLPAFATAYDWLALDRTPAGLRKWENTTMHSAPSLVFASVFSSIAFALLHSDQLGHAWGALGVLFAVSLCFSYIRVKTYSVACSALAHATYNGVIFLAALIATGGYRHLEKLVQ